MPLNLRKNRECFQLWVKGYFRRLSSIQLFTLCKSLHWTKLLQKILRLFWKRPVYIHLMSGTQGIVFFVFNIKLENITIEISLWTIMKRCRGNPTNLLTVSHWMLQKFCNLSCTVCCRNSATTSPLDVAEILLPLTHWMLQKFCDHLYIGCCRNSATIYTLGVAEILQPLIL